MFDNCTIFFSKPPELKKLVSGENSFDWNGIPFYRQSDHTVNARLSNEKAKLELTAHPNRLSPLRCKGSLHAFGNGTGNHAPVSLQQLQTGIDTLSSLFGLGRFIWIEYAYNIPTGDSEQILKQIRNSTYNGQPPDPMKSKKIEGKVYGYKFDLTDYSVKFYEKHKEVKATKGIEIDPTLRVETKIRASYLTKRFNLPYRITTETIFKRETFNAFNSFLLYTISKIEIATATGLDYSQLSAAQIEAVTLLNDQKAFENWKLMVSASTVLRKRKTLNQAFEKNSTDWLANLQRMLSEFAPV